MKKVFASICLLMALSLTGLVLLFERSVIKKQGTYDISGLKNEVKVYFDEFGIPHIEAQNAQDGMRTLGFITASERLFQMELLRRVINGSLSEVFGSKTLDIDILSRKMKFKRHAKKLLDDDEFLIRDEIKQKMQAYIEGVNQYIETMPLSAEFLLLDFRPGPFELADVLGVSSYMGMGFAEGLTSDVLFSELMETLPAEKMELLRIGTSVDQDYFSTDKVVRLKVIDQIQSAVQTVEDYLPLFSGSNAWVLSGKRSSSGFPIFANDPHIKMSNPHIFFEAHIKYPGLDLYGNYIPLSPFPVMGHTPQSAWGLTMAEVDDVSIYQEKINPENSGQVMYKNNWVDMSKFEESINIKGKAKPYKLIIYESPHGVLLDETKFGVNGKNLALNWSGHHPKNNIITSFHDLAYATTVEEFKRAVSHGASPALNVLWATKWGDIGWWVLGKFPKLPDGLSYDVVLNGWDGKHEIERYYSFEENPHSINPESGVIVSANQKPDDEKFNYLDGYWQPAGRYEILKKRLEQKKKWKLVDLMRLQLDDSIPISETFVKQILKRLDVSKLSLKEKEVLNELKKWNGKSDIESIGSSIFHMLSFYIAQNVFKDELGSKNLKKLAKSADHWHALKKVMLDLDHTFWDNVKTNRVESSQEIITLSFKESVKSLTKRLGPRVSSWNWGRLHKLKLKHILGSRWPLNYIFNTKSLSAPGARYSVNNLGHRRLTDDFSVISGPATRRLIDFSHPQRSLGILPSGNSGNPFSNHFEDQMSIYLNGKYRLQLMDWGRIYNLPVLKLK